MLNLPKGVGCIDQCRKLLVREAIMTEMQSGAGEMEIDKDNKINQAKAKLKQRDFVFAFSALHMVYKEGEEGYGLKMFCFFRWRSVE